MFRCGFLGLMQSPLTPQSSDDTVSSAEPPHIKCLPPKVSLDHLNKTRSTCNDDTLEVHKLHGVCIAIPLNWRAPLFFNERASFIASATSFELSGRNKKLVPSSAKTAFTQNSPQQEKDKLRWPVAVSQEL